MSRTTTSPAAFAAAYGASPTKVAAFAAALGGKAAQVHEVAPWPYHPIAIENPSIGGRFMIGLFWGVIDLRKGHGREALVGSRVGLRSLWQGKCAAETATQLAYDLHELAKSVDDEDYHANYIAASVQHVIVRL